MDESQPSKFVHGEHRELPPRLQNSLNQEDEMITIAPVMIVLGLALVGLVVVVLVMFPG